MRQRYHLSAHNLCCVCPVYDVSCLFICGLSPLHFSNKFWLSLNVFHIQGVSFCMYNTVFMSVYVSGLCKNVWTRSEAIVLEFWTNGIKNSRKHFIRFATPNCYHIHLDNEKILRIYPEYALILFYQYFSFDIQNINKRASRRQMKSFLS